MKIQKKGKIKLRNAIPHSIRSIRKCWKTLLLFAVISITLVIAIEMTLSTIGFIDFLGGYIVSKLVVGIIQLLYIFVIIKTTSNIMKGESTYPIKILKTSFSKLRQVIFQGIICSAVLVPSALIVLVLLIAITEAKMVSIVIIYILLSILCVKLIFSIHSVLIGNLDGLDGIKESISITKGNYFKLILTMVGLWLINYATKSALGLLLNGNLIAYIVNYIASALMTILQLTLLTSLYHQIVSIDDAQQAELFQIV